MTTDPYVHETSFHVRYAETDQMGLVHHAAYIVWFEEGRSDYMRALGSGYDDFEAAGLALPVVECYARYVAAARYDQLITVRTRIDERKSRRLTFSYEIVDPERDTVLVTGYTRHVCVDHDGNLRRFPPEWRALMERL